MKRDWNATQKLIKTCVSRLSKNLFPYSINHTGSGRLEQFTIGRAGKLVTVSATDWRRSSGMGQARIFLFFPSQQPNVGLIVVTIGLISPLIYSSSDAQRHWKWKFTWNNKLNTIETTGMLKGLRKLFSSLRFGSWACVYIHEDYQESKKQALNSTTELLVPSSLGKTDCLRMLAQTRPG